MRIWGYILIFLNLIAAGAFLYLATMVVKQKRDWTDAALRAEFIIHGTSVDTPPPIPPDDLEENYVPFQFNLYGIQPIDQLPKDVVKKLIPLGGTPTPAWPFPAKASEFITSQTGEVERVRKIFDEEVTKRVNNPADQRKYLSTYLINLARSGPERDGINGLLRDYPDDTWRDVARQELPYLGRTALQQDALRALGNIAFLENDLDRQKPENVRKGRLALDLWADKMVEYVVPKPVPDARGIRAEAAMSRYAEDKKVLEPALKALLVEADSENPDPAKISTGKARITELGDTLAGKPKKKLDILANVAGNPLKTAQDITDARKQLLDLAQWQARTDAEKEALAGVADLLMPPALAANLTPEEIANKKQERIIQGPLQVAKALMKQHFEEAFLPASKPRPEAVAGETREGTQDPLSALRDPQEKRTAIAHLLYNLDADRYDKPAERKPWHERVAAIVGYEAYVKEAEEQASALYQMIPRINTFVLEDQAAFEDYYQLLIQYALYLAFRLEEVQEQLKVQLVLAADHNTLVEARTAEKNALTNELTAERAKTKAAIDALTERQTELFRITKQLGEAQDALVGLEEKLRVLELGFVKP